MDYSVGYMPHIEGDWDNTRDYTPMSIVKDGGTSYIAKVAVPIGAAITNTYYWQVFSEGVQGVGGSDGAQGAAGTNGTDGADGAQGYTGSQGANGANGTNGTNGDDGSSIFFYLEPLHNGQLLDQNKIINPLRLDVLPGSTVTDVTGQVGYLDANKKWIYSYTIHQGAQGAQGVQGMAGEYAAQGIAGHDGAQGVQGPQGIPGEYAAQGAKGQVGPQGAKGSDGANGAQSIVYLTQQEYEDLSDKDPDTFYLITDAQGPQGADGADGAQGADGSQGIQGMDGAYAAQGIQGATGAQGFDGPQGIAGAYAAQGIQGATGAQGFDGPQGATGAQGSDGPQGIQGVAGHSPANTEQWSFTLIDNSILNRTVYMVPQS